MARPGGAVSAPGVIAVEAALALAELLLREVRTSPAEWAAVRARIAASGKRIAELLADADGGGLESADTDVTLTL